MLSLLFCALRCTAQISFRDSVREYDKQRMIINIKGVNVLAGWSAASIIDGAIGYNTAKADDWKYFHQATGIVGVINGGIATYGMLHTRKQLMATFNPDVAFANYKKDRNVLLVSIGVDLGCMATGAYLLNRAQKNVENRDMNLGYGRALLLQGLFLTALDNILLLSHNRYSDRWGRILDEVRVSGQGLSYVHTF